MNAPLIPGGRYDEAAAFAPIKVAVLTISDTRDEESDTSGHLLAERVTGAGHLLAGRAIVADDVARGQPMAGACHPLGEQMARGVALLVAGVRDGQHRHSDRREDRRLVQTAAHGKAGVHASHRSASARSRAVGSTQRAPAGPCSFFHRGSRDFR